jgi:glycosyltransferase involved in cell wall biosynthesis
MKILVVGNYQKKLGGAHSAMLSTANLLSHKYEVKTFSLDIDVDDYFLKKYGNFYKIVRLLFFPIFYIYNPLVRRRLQSLIKEFRPDCINVHLYIGGLSNSVISAIKANSIPSIHTVHDYRGICPANAMLDNKGKICESCKRGLRFSFLKRCADGSILKSLFIYLEAVFRRKFFPLYKSFDRLIFVSDFCKQKYLAFDPLYDGNIEVINNFSEIEFSGKKNTETHSINYDFIYIGRLSKEKGIDSLINAFSDLDFSLAIVGNGPLRKIVEESALAFTNIEYLGELKNSQVSQCLSLSRFMILPSKWYENNPLSLIEAFSLGVPCVGSNIGGIPELIEEDKTGFLFDPFNTENLKKTLKKAILLNKEEYSIYSDNCLKKYEQSLSKISHLMKLESLIRKIS